MVFAYYEHIRGLSKECIISAERAIEFSSTTDMNRYIEALVKRKEFFDSLLPRRWAIERWGTARTVFLVLSSLGVGAGLFLFVYVTSKAWMLPFIFLFIALLMHIIKKTAENRLKYKKSDLFSDYI